MVTGDADRELLQFGDMVIEGQLATASNTTLRCAIERPNSQVLRCVYKPMKGERPLWDFPTGTLSRREVAMYELSQVLGIPHVPLTVWRTDGPLGPGMCQVWIDDLSTEHDVDVCKPGALAEGFTEVLTGENEYGEDVVLAHRRQDDVRAIALLDIIANNADRKGGHILADSSGRRWAIDHGLTFHAEPKLRTVLWGWAGESIAEDLDRMALDADVIEDAIGPWVSRHEVLALVERIENLVETPQFPFPISGRPAVPWPIF